MAVDRNYTDRLLQTVSPPATTDLSDPQTILHRAYSAVLQGNFDAFSDSVTEDVELNIWGFAPMDGNWRGRSEVIAATRKNFGLVTGQQPEVEGIISQGACIAVLLRESGVVKSTGQPYNLRGIQWFTFADGKIKKIDEILASI
jgi:ketosteroid isomerase-like protein